MANTTASDTTAGIRANWKPLLFLVVGLFAAATAATFMRLAQAEGVPSVTIAAGRLIVATVALTPLVIRFYSDDLRRLTRREFLWAALAGVWLSLHFIAYITSLEYASVMIGQLLLGLSPLWIAFLEVLFLKARFGKWVWFGLGFTLLGGTIIALAGSQGLLLGGNPAIGVLWGIGASIAVAIYMVIGRRTRGNVASIPYIWIVYGCAAITTLIIALFSRTAIAGHSAQGYFWVLMIGLLPQLVAHSSYNYAMKFFPATYISLMLHLTTILATLLAVIVLHEIPGGTQVLGAGIIICGVLLASRDSTVESR